MRSVRGQWINDVEDDGTVTGDGVGKLAPACARCDAPDDLHAPSSLTAVSASSLPATYPSSILIPASGGARFVVPFVSYQRHHQ